MKTGANAEEFWHKLSAQLGKIPGGYNYMGVASDQYCFPLKGGGELRIMVDDETYPEVHVDLYGGELPPGITGPVKKTG